MGLTGAGLTQSSFTKESGLFRQKVPIQQLHVHEVELITHCVTTPKANLPKRPTSVAFIRGYKAPYLSARKWAVHEPLLKQISTEHNKAPGT